MLAGGASSRMGRDKALLPVQGSTLLEQVAREVLAVTGSVTVIAPPERYIGIGLSVIPDLSPGQGPLQVAAEKSPPGTFAVVMIRPRKGGDGLKYTVPMSFLPTLGQINSTIQDPLGRYNAVMALPDLFTVESVKQPAPLTQN